MADAAAVIMYTDDCDVRIYIYILFCHSAFLYFWQVVVVRGGGGEFLPSPLFAAVCC